MNNHTAAVLFGNLMSAAIGLIGGWAIGDLVRRYRQGAEQLDALRRQLLSLNPLWVFQQRQLKELRGVVNDVRAATKSLEKPPLLNPTKSMSESL